MKSWRDADLLHSSKILKLSDISLSPGYKIEAIHEGLTFSSAITFDDDGNLYVFRREIKRPAVVLGGLSSIAFICIDFYYALTDVISDVYLLAGFIQIGFFFAWIYFSVRHKAQLS